jgi:hypothetical protein
VSGTSFSVSACPNAHDRPPCRDWEKCTSPCSATPFSSRDTQRQWLNHHSTGRANPDKKDDDEKVVALDESDIQILKTYVGRFWVVNTRVEAERPYGGDVE